MKNSYKGKFQIKNPGKYKGDYKNIVFRSLWELRFMKYLDTNNSVIEWSSEELVIPYISPVDGRYHRYFPDFKVLIRNKNNEFKTYLIEIKPHAQTKEPKVQKRKTRKYLTEVMTWGINSAKWESARNYCTERGWEFIVMDEYALGIKDKY